MASVITAEVASTTRERLAWWFRGAIDGLRAIAIVMVVAFHAGVPGIRGGFTGVDVFFVISGYLITRNLVCEVDRTNRVNACNYRISRVWPTSGPLITAERKVSAKMGVPRLDVPDVICARGTCRMEIAGALVYVDSHHLTDAFAMSQKPALGALVDQLVR